MSKQKGKTNRFDDEFKRSAVELVVKGHRTVQDVATSLGISENTLYQWKKTIVTTTMAGKSMLEQENERLKKENAELRQEKEILKKSVAIFLRPQR